MYIFKLLFNINVKKEKVSLYNSGILFEQIVDK